MRTYSKFYKGQDKYEVSHVENSTLVINRVEGFPEVPVMSQPPNDVYTANTDVKAKDFGVQSFNFFSGYQPSTAARKETKTVTFERKLDQQPASISFNFGTSVNDTKSVGIFKKMTNTVAEVDKPEPMDWELSYSPIFLPKTVAQLDDAAKLKMDGVEPMDWE
ncbi:uncharacterized protein LOC119678561 [Teleopsis dalmanni]|uniref:uncharacterized protein LOC119678561 n=1 Tax=Teleopsis dalmanni TaxID=139649 RepID=UPI0018CD4BDC|nr:uncharacterized protein LOC119678561 [Teleopsis dalmanni]